MAVPTVGRDTAGRLAQMMAASAQQKRSQALAARFGAIDERTRKMDRLHALLQQRMAEVKAREARKKAEGSDGLGGKVGAGVGAALGLGLALPTGGLSLLVAPALGAGLGTTLGGIFDKAPGGGQAVTGGQALQAGNQAMSLMEKMQGMGLLAEVPTQVPLWGPGATAASPSPGVLLLAPQYGLGG